MSDSKFKEDRTNVKNDDDSYRTNSVAASYLPISSEEIKALDPTKFYSTALEYWSKQPPTVNGMLGGFHFVSKADVIQSHKFLNHFEKSKDYLIEKKLAIDCGAGIGRVTKHLLLKHFENVEMVDVTENFINKAKEYLGPEDASRVSKFHCCGLQSFYPEPNKYDCIWIQWVLCYLNEQDLLEFLKRCKQALKRSGICVLKENVSISEFEFDATDSSYTRPKQAFVDVIHQAGMRVLNDEKQNNFPSELYEVRMIAFN